MHQISIEKKDKLIMLVVILGFIVLVLFGLAP